MDCSLRESPLPQKQQFLDLSGPRKGQNSLHKGFSGVPKNGLIFCKPKNGSFDVFLGRVFWAFSVILYHAT